MAKDEKSKAGGPKAGKASQAAVVPATAVGEPKPRITEKEYQRELRRMHGEVVAMQEWVKATGAKVCIVFEGRDGAGKGGVIKAITERVSPRVFRLVALPAPSDRERTQMYIQRYLPHFPAGGEVVIFDRSWYNRAGVERVMGFTAHGPGREVPRTWHPGSRRRWSTPGSCSSSTGWRSAPRSRPAASTGRIDDARKTWKLSPMDVASYTRWDDYTTARDAMFAATEHVLGAMVRRQHRRQEARSAQRDLPPAVPRPLRARRRRDGGAAEAVGDGGAAPAGHLPPRA